MDEVTVYAEVRYVTRARKVVGGGKVAYTYSVRPCDMVTQAGHDRESAEDIVPAPLRGRSESGRQNSLKLTNTEHRSKDIRRRENFERGVTGPGMRLSAEMPGANPGLKQKREGQMFEAWGEELNRGDRLRGGSAVKAHVGAAAQRAEAKKGAEARDAREREVAEAMAKCARCEKVVS